MSMTTSTHLVVLLSALTVATLSAQEPARTAAAAVPAGGANGQLEASTSAAYSYDPQGRRDPFVSLLTRGADPRSATTRPAGLAGVLVREAVVKGIVRDRSGFIAMIQGPSGKTFIVRSGEKLMDGTVKAITADSVVFAEDVNEPLSVVKQKEVRKAVRAADGGRG